MSASPGIGLKIYRFTLDFWISVKGYPDKMPQLPNCETRHNTKITMGYLTAISGIIGQTSIGLDLSGSIVFFLGTLVIIYSYKLEN